MSRGLGKIAAGREAAGARCVTLPGEGRVVMVSSSFPFPSFLKLPDMFEVFFSVHFIYFLNVKPLFFNSFLCD